MTNNNNFKDDLNPIPLDHQKDILKELKGQDRALVYMASGAGKTHTSAFYAKNTKPKSILYMVHRNEILNQSIKIFKQVCGTKMMNDYTMGIINSGNKDFHKPFLFATVQTLSRVKNLKRMNHGREIDLFIIDEYHHEAARTYQRIIKKLKYNKLLGLTATPNRSDGQDILKDVNGLAVGKIDIFDGIRRKILVPFHYNGIYDNIDWSDVKPYQNHKYRIMDMDRKLLVKQRDKLVIDEYLEKIEPEKTKTIGFCATIEHVRRMVRIFNENGIRAEGITYKDKIEKRRKILEQFRNGKDIKVLFTVDILNEGVDFPECGALMLLRPTMSRTIFEQQLGRGLRTMKGKKRLLVLDFISNYINAYKVKTYLQEIAKTSPKVTGANYKPIYEMDLPQYEFQSQVIDMMELQEKMKRDLTKYGSITVNEIREIYFSKKRELGLNENEFIHSRQWDKLYGAKYRHHLRHLGYTWHKFLEVIGEGWKLICPVCNVTFKTFRKHNSKIRINRFCSRKCAEKYHNSKRLDDQINRSRLRINYSCFNCKKVFQRFDDYKKPEHRFCSVKCASASHVLQIARNKRKTRNNGQ